jgi:hypothetical protein
LILKNSASWHPGVREWSFHLLSQNQFLMTSLMGIGSFLFCYEHCSNHQRSVECSWVYYLCKLQSHLPSWQVCKPLLICCFYPFYSH